MQTRNLMQTIKRYPPALALLLCALPALSAPSLPVLKTGQTADQVQYRDARGGLLFALSADGSRLRDGQGNILAVFVPNPLPSPFIMQQAVTAPAVAAPATMQIAVLVMPYTDDSGVTYPASVWMPAAVTQDIIDLQGSVDMRGYRDVTAFLAHKAPIAQHLTHVGTAAFVAGSQQAPQGTTQAQNTAALAFGFALSVLDTPVLDAAGKPVMDAQGKPTKQVFYQGATRQMVTLPVGP